MRFEEKVAIATEAVRGIGRGIILKSARRMANTTISDLEVESANLVMSEIN